MPAIDDGALIGMMLKDIDKRLPEEEKKTPLLYIVIFIASLIGWIAMIVIALLAVLGISPVADPMMWLVGLFAFEIISYYLLVFRYLGRAKKTLLKVKEE